jgi:hypothetical protein
MQAALPKNWGLYRVEPGKDARNERFSPFWTVNPSLAAGGEICVTIIKKCHL